MANTSKMTVLCEYLVDKFIAHKADLGLPIGADIENVFYGDQDKILATPCICVEPDVKTSELSGAMRVTTVEFRIGILVYAGRLTDPQGNRRDSDTMAEAVEDLIHADATFGTNPNQLVYDSMVTTTESGYTRKGDNTVLRSSKLTVVAHSKIILPRNP